MSAPRAAAGATALDVRCWVFDFDGTLVDSNRIKRSAYDEVLAEVPGGVAAAARVLAANPRDDRHAAFEKIAAALRSEGRAGLPPATAWVARYSEICEERVSRCAPLPHALDALDSLGARHPLYVASATPEAALVRIVRARGWVPLFRGVFGGPRTKVENLERIAQRERLAPEQLAYVGDGDVDRDAARRFGCRFAGPGAPPLALPDGPLARLVDEIVARSRGADAQR